MITSVVLLTCPCMQASRFWAAGSDSEEESESEVEETSSEEESDSSSSSDEGSQKKGPSRYHNLHIHLRTVGRLIAFVDCVGCTPGPMLLRQVPFDILWCLQVYDW